MQCVSSSSLLQILKLKENKSFSKSEMASPCRSAVMAASRNLVSRSRTVTQKSLNLKPTAASSPFASVSQSIPRASRVLSALGSVETMIPLHTAVASARLRSSIAADSSCWSWLSQELGAPR